MGKHLESKKEELCMVLKMRRDVSFGEKIKQIKQKQKQKQTSLRVRKEVKKLKGKNFSSPSLPVRGLQLHYFLKTI